jgi:hypothetical protein
MVIDAFVPRMDGRTTREVYEDDGVSPAYQRGEYSRTAVTLERYKNKCMLRIDNIEGDYQERLRERSWVVRLHLHKHETPNMVKLDGVKLSMTTEESENIGAKALLISPSSSAKKIPFRGQGSAPGPEGGAVLEVVVPTQSTGRQVVVEVEL